MSPGQDLIQQLASFMPKVRQMAGEISRKSEHVIHLRTKMLANVSLAIELSIPESIVEEFRLYHKRSRPYLQEIEQIKRQACMPVNYDMILMPGIGGEEAFIFANDLASCYNKVISRLSKSRKIIEGKSIIWYGIGHEAAAELRWEEGVHRVQRIPSTGKKDKMHTSTAVVILRPIYAHQVDLDRADFDVTYARSGGPGGQHVNKTSSMIRINHRHSDISVKIDKSRDQEMNRQAAWELMSQKINEKIHSIVRSITSDGHVSMDRSVKIRTYNYQSDRMVDHRCMLSKDNLSEIMKNPRLFMEFIDEVKRLLES